MSNIITPKINNPQNFKSSNTLVTTRKPHYATKVDTAFNIVPGMHRPNANNVPSNLQQDDFIGPDFKARPLKHWRRQLVPTKPSGDNSTQKRMSKVYFMDTPGSTIYKSSDDSCRCLVNNAPNIDSIVPEVPGAVVIRDIYYDEGDSTVPEIININPNTPIQISVEIENTIYNGHNSFEIADAFKKNNFGDGIKLQNDGQIDVPPFYLSAPIIQGFFNETDGENVIIATIEYNDTNHIPPVPIIVSVDPITPYNEYPNPDPEPTTIDTNYHIYTGVFDTECIACNPEINVIKSGIVMQSQSYYTSITQYLESRCRTYAQRESTIKLPDDTYYPNPTNNIPFTFLYPNDNPRGPQVYEPKNCANPKIYNNNALNTPPNNYCSTIYKPNNPQFARQGAVSGSTRLQKLKSDTITSNGFSYYSAYGATMANAGNFQGTSESNNYFVKNRNFPLTQYIALDKYRQNKLSGCCIKENISLSDPVIQTIFNGVPNAPIIYEIMYEFESTVPEIDSITLEEIVPLSAPVIQIIFNGVPDAAIVDDIVYEFESTVPEINGIVAF